MCKKIKLKTYITPLLPKRQLRPNKGFFDPSQKLEEPTISDKNYGKNCYLDNFVFLPVSPLHNVEKQ